MHNLRFGTAFIQKRGRSGGGAEKHLYYVLSCSADQQSIADLLSRCKRQRFAPLVIVPDGGSSDRIDPHEIPHAGYIGGVTVGSPPQPQAAAPHG